jgi:hypothetical protein
MEKKIKQKKMNYHLLTIRTEKKNFKQEESLYACQSVGAI